jgi:uncharacterized protein YdhG (YjbR/CyaY superfamily)
METAFEDIAVPTPATVDAYVDAAPPVAQPAVRELRRLILAELPAATERISYGMPSYHYRGRRFLHFAAAKGHVGVYGLVHKDGVVPDGLAPYLDHRSTLRLAYDRPLPSAALAAAIRRKAKAADQGD